MLYYVAYDHHWHPLRLMYSFLKSVLYVAITCSKTLLEAFQAD